MMDLVWIIQLFILLPLVGFGISLVLPKKNEWLLSRVAHATTALTLLLSIAYVVLWSFDGFNTLNLKEFTLFKSTGYEFLIDFYFDKVTAVYLLVGAFLTFLITVYSRYYLHREEGYKRFFNTILLFYLGYNITIFSGNFETLFVGWELLGMSSFLLIAYYRDRYLPVRNAVKVFSIYRIGDVGILMAMWASHHLWHENITFLKLNNYDLVHEHLLSHTTTGIFISIMLVVAATAKSAQFPFSSWLPRAMEGPTPSSAIFYGSLSVHFGVFLLLRTHPFWEHQIAIQVIIILIGLITSIIGYFTARVQSTIKSQIAYASVAQIGLIFIEIALGFENLALFHFAGNAFLRTYQLLVSPSIVSYLIREQFYHFQPKTDSAERRWSKKLENTVYLLSLKEWNLDVIISRFVFKPLKQLGQKLDFLSVKNVFYYFIPIYALGLWALSQVDNMSFAIKSRLPEVFAFIGLILVFKAFSERKYPILSWILLIMNHFLIALAISFNEDFSSSHIMLYLSGVVVSGVIGWLVLSTLKKREPNYFSLNQYFGHGYEYPKLSLLFLLSSLGLMGFPITATFIGEDLIFSHIHENQYLLAFYNALSFIIAGIALIRIYARLFLGNHIKTYHEVANKSA